MGTVRMAEVTDLPLDRVSIEKLVLDETAGGVVTFSGLVRDHDHGRAVASLLYEAHPMAQAIIESVANDINARFDVVSLAVAHRVGDLAIGDAALVVSVSAAHRGEAFAACQALVDLTKERLPVWKHQLFVDGSDEWVNCA